MAPKHSGPELARIGRVNFRHGVSAAVAAVALVALVAGGAAALYLSGALGGASSTACATTSTFSAEGVETTITIPCGGSTNTQIGGGGGGVQSQGTTSTSSSTSSTSSTLTTTSSTNTNVLETFNAHYEWSRTLTSAGSTETFTASGTFTFTIDFSSKSGQGNGQGTIEDKYTGECTGDSTTSYTFQVYAGVDTISGNLSIGFGVADPATGSTQVTCGSSSATNSFGFGAVLPVPLNIQAEYGASVAGEEGGSTYEVTLA